MEQLKDIESYINIINRVKKENLSTYTNCYLYQDKVKKFIYEGRMYFEEISGGVVIYTDEKRYYEAFCYLSTDSDWCILPKEKDIYLKNIYLSRRKSRKLIILEEKMKSCGFYLMDRLGQMEGNIYIVRQKLEKFYYNAKKIMDQYGFYLVIPDKQLLPQIREFERSIKEIPIYQIPYYKDKEIIMNGNEGLVVCIVSKNMELCAIRVLREKNSPYGYIAVKDKYQKMFGMAVVLSYDLLNYLEKNNLRPLTWVDCTNIKSIDYHMKIGYKWTGKYTEEWILKAKNQYMDSVCGV